MRAARLLEQADDIVETLIAAELDAESRARFWQARVFLHEALLALSVDACDDAKPPEASVVDLRAKSSSS